MTVGSSVVSLAWRDGTGVVEALQSLLGPAGLAAFEALTHLGDATVIAPVLALYYWRWGDRDRAAVAAALALAALALAEAAKAAFGLPRPPAALQAAPATGSGFPSGHALGAAAVWGGLAALDGRWSARRRYGLAGAAVAVVAVSRVALGVHYPVDVVVGAAVGAALAAVVVATARDRPLVVFAGAAALGGLALAVAGATFDAAAAAGGAVGGGVAWWGLTERSAFRDAERPAEQQVTWPAAVAALATLGGGWVAVEAVVATAATVVALGAFVGAAVAVGTMLWVPVVVGRLRA